MKITLARALKYKGRVIERMRKLEQDIHSYNSMLAGAQREVDPAVALKERLELEDHLLNLKLVMDKANEPIKFRILAMQELKGRITFLQQISTTHGKVDARRTMYGQEGEMIYEAAIRKAEVDELMNVARNTIDNIQEEVDKFNNTATIEIDVLPLK
jgi:hypothetical protein